MEKRKESIEVFIEMYKYKRKLDTSRNNVLTVKDFIEKSGQSKLNRFLENEKRK